MYTSFKEDDQIIGASFTIRYLYNTTAYIILICSDLLSVLFSDTLNRWGDLIFDWYNFTYLNMSFSCLSLSLPSFGRINNRLLLKDGLHSRSKSINFLFINILFNQVKSLSKVIHDSSCLLKLIRDFLNAIA